jgi:hypothetical protein
LSPVLCPGEFLLVLVVYILTDRTNILGRCPLIKTPFANLAASLVPADRADIVLRKILKRSSRRNIIVRFATEW